MTILNSRLDSVVEERNEYYLLRPFLKEKVVAAFSTRKWNMLPDALSGEFSSEHLLDFCETLNVSYQDLVYFHQVHGKTIVEVNLSLKGYGIQKSINELIEADAAMTEAPKIPLAIFTADCAPVFFYDSLSRSIGLAHIGWRGAEQGLTREMVVKFQSNLRSKPNDLLIGFGPMIRSCCYEVGEAFCEKFGTFVLKRDSKFYFDLSGFIRNELINSGILDAQIYDSGFCTVCQNHRFFSYRREGKSTGRICSLIAKY